MCSVHDTCILQFETGHHYKLFAYFKSFFPLLCNLISDFISVFTNTSAVAVKMQCVNVCVGVNVVDFYSQWTCCSNYLNLQFTSNFVL